MRYVDRSSIAPPASLVTPSEAVEREKNAAIDYYQTYDVTSIPRPKAYEFSKYKAFDVTSSLRVLFHDKCAYCEDEVGDDLDVEHFRPKGGVTEDATHPGYWWLAHTWENLLPSCSPCNQSRRQHLITEDMTEKEFLALRLRHPDTAYGKANQFPIGGVRALYGSPLDVELPHLIDPTVDNPENFLMWSQAGPYSVVLAKPVDHWSMTRALASISVFALNRLRLVQSRTKILTELRYQAVRTFEELEEDMIEGGSPQLIERALKRVREMRRMQASDRMYSSMVKEFIDGFERELRSRIAG